jgi:hypothetical protein
MKFIKEQWITLMSGLVALICIGVAIFGMTSSAVVDEMNTLKEKAREIDAIEPRNQDCIDAEQRRAQRFAEEYENTLNAAQEINRREPLIPDAFPRPARTSTPFAFQQKYVQVLKGFLARLEADDLPNQDDLDDAKEQIEEILRKRAEEKSEGGETAAAITQERGAFNPRGGPPGIVGRGAGAYGGGGSESDNPMERPEGRARVLKARNIRTYASLDESRSSFHVSPIIKSDIAPSESALWYAQVGYWIQQDIVNALAELNDAAAAQTREGEPNVEHMPVKRIETIRVYGYWKGNGVLIEFPALGQSTLPSSPIASFTNKVCDDKFDVVRFAMTLVVDQRDLPRVIDAIKRQNFYQLIGLEYDAINSADQASQGYMYGGDPCVRLTMHWEGYLSRKAFLEYMPESVQAELGVKKGN